MLQFGRRFYISGQIALNPASMTLIDGGAVMQSRLSLQHVRRVLDVMSNDACLCNSLLVICYATSYEAALSAETELNCTLSSSVYTTDVSDVNTCCYVVIKYEATRIAHIGYIH